MTDLLPIARFPLPDDWSVETTTCVVFRVPDDPQYVSQIIGLVDMLKWSRNFALDDTRSGAASVSRTWQAALESMPVEVGCNMFLLRQNPSNLCQLQQSLDGGESWTLAFDYSLCGINAPPPSGTVDRAAALIRGFHEGLIEQVIAQCAEDRATAISNLTNWIRTYDPTYANPAALGTLYDEVCALSPEDQAELTTDCAWIAEYESLSECDSIEAWYDWLDCIAETLGSTLDTWATAIGNALNNAAAALGLGGIGAFTNGGGAGGGGGFGTDCWDWMHEFDYSVSDGGFTAVSGAGVWTTGYPTGGTAWRSPDSGNDLDIRRTFDERWIVKVEIDYHMSVAGWNCVQTLNWTLPDNTNEGLAIGDIDSGEFTIEYALGKTIKALIPGAEAPPPLHYLWIRKFRVYGLGTDPF